jgi:RNA polymerase sigma factor (sigma-70 family)
LSGRTVYIIPEEELVRRVQEKDKLAFEYLYDRYSKAIYGVIFRILKSEEATSEVLNDAFLRYWERSEKYDFAKGKLYTWMVNIARNLAIDKTRSKEFSQSGKTDSVESFVYADAALPTEDMKVDSIGVRELLSKLKPDQAEIVDLMYFQGYTQSEIEEKFNIPLGTVKTRLRAGMILLRKLLNVDK